MEYLYGHIFIISSLVLLVSIMTGVAAYGRYRLVKLFMYVLSKLTTRKFFTEITLIGFKVLILDKHNTLDSRTYSAIADAVRKATRR